MQIQGSRKSCCNSLSFEEEAYGHRDGVSRPIRDRGHTHPCIQMYEHDHDSHDRGDDDGHDGDGDRCQLLHQTFSEYSQAEALP